MGDPSAEDRLARLRASYREALPERIRELDAATVRAREDGTPDALGEARRIAHTLKGTTGSYGFANLSSALEALEVLLDEALSGEAPPRWAEITDALARVQAALP